MPTVTTEDEDITCDAVLLQGETICCVDADRGRATILSFDRVERVEADADLLVTPPELPDWFFGGGEYGFVAVDRFPDLADHRDALDRSKY